MKSKRAAFKRVVLKISGEALQGSQHYGIDHKVVLTIAKQIKTVNDSGVEIACVIGAGNIFRGMQAVRQGMDRVNGDYIGMLATMINSLSLQDALEKLGVHTRVMTAIPMEKLAEPYIRRRALRHLEKRRVVIFAAGTGNPYFTTDTAAALRAIEINADAVLKATRVDGVYSGDPLKDKKAKRFVRLKYLDVLKKQLQVMDATAVSLCMENKLPIVVFNLNTPGNIEKVMRGDSIGTVVS